MEIVQWELRVAWTAIVCGFLFGVGMGSRFANPAWLGGYTSFPRRLIRLGHVSFFGIAALNVLVAATFVCVPNLPERAVSTAAALFGAANFAMPAVCFLTAYDKRLQAFFALPVCMLVGGASTILFAL